MPPSDLVHALIECGFALFYKECNVVGTDGDCTELAFVRVNYPDPITDPDLTAYGCT